ncbi:unnamed protein product [Adineta ricciae]|uniref:LITAF domain-containing protein n=1 Tax=Adineta ricciae TaxID=249248 RepID=A0A814DQD5_ADIRI|nr:unnamed protein product [Adineta ricciae]CAF0956855.1 unnamed protein product [Adineta ricciae]
MQSAPPPPYTEKVSYESAPPPVQTAQPIFLGSPVVSIGTYPVQCICPHCRTQIVSQTAKKPGLLAWLLCGGMALLGFWLCCFIPFCIDSCKDTEHYCPNCHILLGVNKTI